MAWPNGRYILRPYSVARLIPTGLASPLMKPGPCVMRFGSLASTSMPIILARERSGNSVGSFQSECGANSESWNPPMCTFFLGLDAISTEPYPSLDKHLFGYRLLLGHSLEGAVTIHQFFDAGLYERPSTRRAADVGAIHRAAYRHYAASCRKCDEVVFCMRSIHVLLRSLEPGRIVHDTLRWTIERRQDDGALGVNEYSSNLSRVLGLQGRRRG